MTHLLYCPFTGLGLYGGYRGDKWLNNRIAIFKNFVLPSLLSQTDKSSYLWVSWRPEEKSNPIVYEFCQFLDKIRGLSVIHTFGGLCFWDDKYPDEVASVKLLEALEKTLPELKSYVGESKYVLVTLQPSDDLYINTAIEDIRKTLSDKEPPYAVGWKKGYIMNYATKEIAEYSTVDWTTDEISTYRTNTIPPFFTVKFPKDVFLNPQKHYKFIGPYKTHELVADVMPYEELSGKGFCVGTHGANISTTFNHRYKGRVLEGDERDKMLIMFGVYFSDPVIIKAGWRIIGRKVLNVIPFNNFIRNKYRQLPVWMQKL